MVFSRRQFLVGAAGAGVGFGLGAVSHYFPLPSPVFGPAWQPGRESFVPSTCLLCPAHCGIRARLVDGKLTRIDGNPLHPVSRGGLCPKGSAGTQLYYHPGRLRGPLQRVGPPGTDTFEPVDWDAALERVASALRSARDSGRAGAVEWVTGDLSGVAAEIVAGFCGAYGTTRIAADDHRDGSEDVLALCQGIDARPAYDLEAADLVLSFGAGLSESWSALPLAATARDHPVDVDRRWIQVDTRLSRTAVAADEWVPVRPGTYGTLALGLAYFMLKEGQYDEDAVTRQVAGWEDWTDDAGTSHLGFRRLVLRHGRPDRVTAATGVPLPRLVALAKTFGRARRPVALWDHVVSWRTGGLADALAIHALNILRGRLNRPGGVLVQRSLPAMEPLFPGAEPAGLSGASHAPTAWPGEGPPPPVLFLYQANPVASASRQEEARRYLSEASLVVSFSPFLDETARYADLVLPDHVYLERWQDAPAPSAVSFPFWGVVQPVVAPLHDTRATGDVILDLAARVGGALEPLARRTSVEAIVRARGEALAMQPRGGPFVEAFRRNELRELEARGWSLAHGRRGAESWKRMLASGGWFDPFYDYLDSSRVSRHEGGRVWLFPAAARRRLRDSGEELAEGFLPARAGPHAPAEPDGEFPLRLVPYRVLTLASGGTTLMPWLLENLGLMTGSSWRTWVEINPETMHEMGLQSGSRVRVVSRHGSFEAALVAFPGAQPGVINVPYGLHSTVAGWDGPDGANPLDAVGARTDPVTGLPDWYSVDVRVVPA